MGRIVALFGISKGEPGLGAGQGRCARRPRGYRPACCNFPFPVPIGLSQFVLPTAPAMRRRRGGETGGGAAIPYRSKRIGAARGAAGEER